MAKPYSIDLRERVVASVEEGGLSRHRAAARFGIGVSTAIAWVRRFRETGSVAPGQMGGTSRGRSATRIATGCFSAARRRTSPYAGLSRSLPSAASRSITARCGNSSMTRI